MGFGAGARRAGDTQGLAWQHPSRSLRLSMVAMFGHADAVEALVAAGVPRVIAHVFVVHLHALSDHA
jgi:hypothetical protein